MASALPLIRRELGPLLPVAGTHGNNYSNSLNGMSRKRTRSQNISAGCGMPLPPQNATVIKGQFQKQDFDRRKLKARRPNKSEHVYDPDHLLAPMGTRESVRAMPGELAYYRIDDADAPYKGNPDTDLICIVDVSGITKDTRLGFAGWVAVAPDSTKDNSDYFGTIQRSGTCTVVNVGPDTIPVGATVYFDENPYALNNRGNTVPGVIEQGQPAAVGNAKFRPALYALTQKDVFAWLSMAEHHYQNAADNNKKLDMPITDHRGLTTAFKDIQSQCTKSVPTTFNLHQYIAMLYYIEKSYELQNMSDLQIHDFIKSVHATVLNTMIKYKNEEMVNMGISGKIDVFTYLRSGVDLSKDRAKKIRGICRDLLQLSHMTVTDLEGWLKSHAVGTALNTSESGAPLDLELAFFY